MTKAKQDRPINSFEVTTYDSKLGGSGLREHVARLFLPKDAYNALLIVGRAATGKSRAVQELYGKKDVATISGKPTPWGFYQWVYAHRHCKILILDDVSKAAFKDPTFIALLKNLLETGGARKRLRWHTEAATQLGIPKEFTTTAKVVILANSWDSQSSEDYAAVDTRAVCFKFSPDPESIHHEVGKWFYDREVYEFIWENLDLMTSPNMRMYIIISQLRRAGDKAWKLRALEIMCGNDKMVKLAQILKDPQYQTVKAASEAFEKATGIKQSQFYSLKQQFRYIGKKPKGQPPELKYTEPPDEQEDDDDLPNVEEDDDLNEEERHLHDDLNDED